MALLGPTARPDPSPLTGIGFHLWELPEQEAGVDQGLFYKAMERAGAFWGRNPFSSWWCQTWN